MLIVAFFWDDEYVVVDIYIYILTHLAYFEITCLLFMVQQQQQQPQQPPK